MNPALHVFAALAAMLAVLLMVHITAAPVQSVAWATPGRAQ